MNGSMNVFHERVPYMFLFVLAPKELLTKLKAAGDNVMAQRNYPCDSLIDAYFGISAESICYSHFHP